MISRTDKSKLLEEVGEDYDSEKDLKFDKTMKKSFYLNQFSKNSQYTKTFEDEEVEQDNQSPRKTPLIFTKAKYLMKPLGSFLDDQKKQQQQVANNNLKLGLQAGSTKDKLQATKIGSHHFPMGLGKMNQTARDPLTSKLKIIIDSSLSSNKRIMNIQTERCEKSLNNASSGALQTQVSENNQKIKNIFEENKDLKQNKVTPLFDSGPRYDKNDQLIKYSIVGKSEWFKKIDQQKNGGKLTHMNMKLSLQNTRRKSSVLGNNPIINQQNFDMKSVLSIRKSSRINGDENNSERQNKQHTVTKDHLLMKFDEIEKRIATNQEKQNEEYKVSSFQEKLDTTRQERSLSSFVRQNDFWNSTAQLLIKKQYSTMNLTDKSALAQQSYSKYKNYTRQNPEDTLLKRSEDIYRFKKEQCEYLEHLKDPYEYIGQKNLWESMLRNDAIDITTKYSQKKKLDNFFFPTQINQNHNQSIIESHDIGTDLKDTFNELNTVASDNDKYMKTSDLLNQTEKIKTVNSITNIQNNENNNNNNNNNNKLPSEVNMMTKQQFSNRDDKISNKSGNQMLPSQKSDFQQSFTPKPHKKIDLTFKKQDFNIRELSSTNGARIQTALNHDNLEVIRSPNRHQNPSFHTNYEQVKNKSIHDSESGVQLNSSRGLTKTFYTSSYYQEREKEQTSKYGSIMKNPYLDYFTQSNIDELAIFGESKLTCEKNLLLNDGKKRFETYLLGNNLQGKKDEQQDVQQTVQNTAQITRKNSTHSQLNQSSQSIIRQSNLSRILTQQQQQQQNQLQQQQFLSQSAYQNKKEEFKYIQSSQKYQL